MREPSYMREAQVIEQLAHRYQTQGYSVERDVILPDSALRADLVARRKDETVLIEVKPSTRDSTSATLKQLAEYAESQGWRFSIVLTRDDDTIEQLDIPTREEVLQWIADAGAVTPSSWVALLAATAAFESAARYALTRTDRRMLPKASPDAHLQALAARGLVTPHEEQILRRLIEARNAAAHGSKMPAVSSDMVPKALEIAAALVADETCAE